MATGSGKSSVDLQRTRAPSNGERTTILLVVGAALLALATGYIHSTLGGLLFTANALGYAVLAGALLASVKFAVRFGWLVRLGLLAFTLSTIGAWILFGARYDVAYLTKAIEAVLVGVLIAIIYRLDGGPSGVLARILGIVGELRGSRDRQ
jgi:hypothetical protein